MMKLSVVIALVLLSACGPNTQLTSRVSPSLALASSEDGCAGAAPLLTRAACANEDLVAANTALTMSVRQQNKYLSREGQQILLDGQSEWFSALRISCALDDNATSLDPETAMCLEMSVFDRLFALADTTELIGPYRFQRVDVFQAFPVSVEQYPDDVPMLSYVSYPRIDAPDASGAAFNNLAKRSLRFDHQTKREEMTHFRIAYADAALISVQFESFDMALDDDEPTRSTDALTFLMGEQRRLRAADVFAPDSAWADAVTEKAQAELIKTPECGRDFQARIVRTASLHAEQWVISDLGLLILYPPFALGPAAPVTCEIGISWEDLASYLSANAPAPIRKKPRLPLTFAG